MMKNITDNKLNLDDKWVFLSSLFEREGACVAETNLSINVHGVYSIPEEWLRLESSGAVDNWFYVVKVSDLELVEGKTNPRELTEQEKREIENKKGGNKKPANAGGKKDEQVDLDKEKTERDEKDKQFMEEWNSLDEKGRFYKKKESPTEECWISFPSGKNFASVLMQGEKLIELDEDVNTYKGIVLEFTKAPPADEDPKKPKPKPKNISPEEVKPIYCVSWLDLSDFHNKPGLKEISLRSPLMLKETYERKIQLEEELDKLSSEGKDTSEVINHLQNLTDYVLSKQTYIYITINFSVPINPPIPEKQIPSSLDLIRKEEKAYKQITADEICDDFRKQLKIAIAAISKQYEDFMGDAKNNLIKREKGNVLSNAKREERDANITKFMSIFNVSGKADLLKEKLKKFIVRIVREKYKKRTNVKGIFKDEKDQFYSELFAYLTDEVKLAMDEYIGLKREELHDHITSSYEQSRKEVLQYAMRINKEPEEKKLLRLSTEYEIMEDLEKALFYYKGRLTLNQGKESWASYAKLTKKMNLIVDCEEAVVNCIKLEPNDIQTKILYAAIKWIKGRSNDAIHFLQALIKELNGIKNTNCNLNAFLAFLYKDSFIQTKDKMKDLLHKKHLEASIRFRLKDQGKVQYLGKSKK